MNLPEHSRFIRRCLDLALLGKGFVEPNPYVGCVIVKDGFIIAEGYHHLFGGAHAEVDAISKITDTSILSDCTIYISLEPCTHYGKTPPCVDLLLKHGFKRVVIGMEDPNPKVQGLGIKKLLDSGAEVIYPVLEEDCQAINKRFIKNQREQLPYILLKWAESSNGYIGQNGVSKLKISNPLTDILVQQLRSEFSSIMIGYQTAKTDKPLLTVRNIQHRKNPIKVIWDYENSLSDNEINLQDNQSAIILNTQKSEQTGSILYLQTELPYNQQSLHTTLKVLFKQGIDSIIVEGGAQLLKKFIDFGLWDEALVIKNRDLIVKEGITAPLLKNQLLIKTQNLGSDTLNWWNKIN